jgi:ubiquinone/menaquinone biosynthesis C-methylase UbiE
LEVVIRRHTDIEVHPHDVFISTFERRLNDCHGFPDWLDVGCGWHFDWPWRAEREANLMSRANVVGIDADREALARHPHITKKAVGCLERLPFNSSSFDLLTANVVMEHVKYPALALSEVFRVLRPGGSFIFRTPSANNYFVKIARLIPQRPKVWLATLIERRKPEDVYPAYYRLNSAPAIAEICKMVGFTRVCITITKPRGVLRRAPLLAAIERAVTGSLGFDEGNLIVEIQK